jgi:hypothetical protein
LEVSMQSFLKAAGLTLAVLVLASVEYAHAQKGKGRVRQYYSKSWTKHPTYNYHYKTYHYKPTPRYTGYKEQHVVYKPAKTKNWVYWYNPEKKVYWARCPTVNHKKYGADVRKGKDYWSYLPQEKKKPKLEDIDDKDYGQVTDKAPYIGEEGLTQEPPAEGKTQVACPPSDLPED